MEFGTLTKLVSGKPWILGHPKKWVYNTLECNEIKNLANQRLFQSHVGLKKFSLCRPWSKLE